MKMLDSGKYYEATMNNKPSDLIRKFFINKYNEKLQGNVAIDLGCGTGNDTAFLLEKGFNVIAIDQEGQVRDIFEAKNLNKENLKLIIDDFSEEKYYKDTATGKKKFWHVYTIIAQQK